MRAESWTREWTIFDAARPPDAADVAADSPPSSDLDSTPLRGRSRDDRACLRTTPDDRDRDARRSYCASTAWMSLKRCYYSSSRVVSLCMCQ